MNAAEKRPILQRDRPTSAVFIAAVSQLYSCCCLPACLPSACGTNQLRNVAKFAIIDASGRRRFMSSELHATLHSDAVPTSTTPHDVASSA